MVAARVLLFTNSARRNGGAGYELGLSALQESGEIGGFHATSGRELMKDHGRQAPEALARMIRECAADIVVVFSPFYFTTTDAQWEDLLAALTGRTVLYWEGDPWGRGKPITRAMSRWLSRADMVFAVAGPPSSGLLRRHGARHVCLIPHVYSQVHFANAEAVWEPIPAPAVDCVMIASNSTRTRIPIPTLTGLPGGLPRYRLGWHLTHDRGRESRVYGFGWPRGWHVEPCEFDQQTTVVRGARVSANWDNYPRLASYTSDRLAISMLAGRPHVSTRHPAMELFPGADEGVYFESSVGDILHRVDEMLARGDEEINRLGRAAWSWVRFRLSERELMRHMLAAACEDVAPVRMDPWRSLSTADSA